MTGTGVVKKDGAAQFVMGVELQVLSGEKRGPKGTLSGSVAERCDVEGKKAAAAEAGDKLKGVAEQAKETVKGKYQQVKSWKDTVQQKTEEERQRPGWNSPAFDALWA